MKKVMCLLPFIFCAHQSLAEPTPSIPDKDDKSVCHFNNTDFELKTTKVSKNNPAYWKEAELMEGVKVEFAKLYVYYGLRTYNFSLIQGDRTISSAETTISFEDDAFISQRPTLKFNSDVVVAGQTYELSCEFTVNGNKNPPPEVR